ncbi:MULTISPECIES: L-threonylcarbamoyladenylate synthase [unclassified Hahella]|uniref:L-threonylcarbamoyladenylate synthase n=1 Tax=unclassified Hahella TaxID=2624107 RepID=UPI001C1E9316|nr:MULTISPECIES: Sua5/YciO/YrdC/YwlC family protein [unclassified Hahella]MBU6950206.1 Sua5/YciO/YrdC/YwlC family protein [Hahella sp. HN01]MDG9666461.1 Sua5/YciO/YrdC/YwlC family protein [Hahella sp. CR1]
MSAWFIQKAVSVLNRGGVLAYPTEAVWGLGCDPSCEDAVNRILQLKRRPWRKGLILVSGQIEHFSQLLDRLPQQQKDQMLASWPGPVTWVVPDPGVYAPLVRGAHDAIAIRVTAHPLVAELTKAFGGPIVSTSANPATREPARTLFDCRRYFKSGVDHYLPGKLSGLNKPSQIRDAATGAILRQ